MKKIKGRGLVQYGIFVTTFLIIVLAYNLIYGDRTLFLPGATTHGHHQIELECDTCHVESFEGGQPMQNACASCHAATLEKVRDTHPKKKFTDPRNADLLANLDATQCVTCHIEHSPEITGEHGLTMPEDFCFYCHQNIAEDRPSHEGFTFTSCSDSGCHSFHDNRALYESFQRKHVSKPALLAKQTLFSLNGFDLWKKKHGSKPALTVADADGARIVGNTIDITVDWASSKHAIAHVNCSTCHEKNNAELLVEPISDLAIGVCEECHQRQVDGFKGGLHGMRVGSGLTPMIVADARLPMKRKAMHETLTCSSCHDPHKPNLQRAATDACLGCHDDEHSNNYSESLHAKLFYQEVTGELSDGKGVSCATCHMPRTKKGKLVFTEHNQTLYLKPNNKMLRPVCINCHGLEFSVAALADKGLIKNNFSGEFEQSHPSFEMVRRRIEQNRAKKSKRAQQ